LPQIRGCTLRNIERYIERDIERNTERNIARNIARNIGLMPQSIRLSSGSL